LIKILKFKSPADPSWTDRAYSIRAYLTEVIYKPLILKSSLFPAYQDCMIYYDCHDMEDVAREYIEECGLLHDVPEMLQNYFDFEAYGRDIRLELNCCFTSYGLVIDNR
jgi:hypothetical protein